MLGWALELHGARVEDRERLLRRGDYCWGSFVKPERVDGYIVGVNPGDRSDVLGRFPFSETSVDDAVDAAARGGITWRRIPRVDRCKILRKYRDNLHRFQEAHADLITRETGKPLWEARQEVIASIRAVDLLVEEGIALLEPRILNEREARSDYRPRGVVGILAPYNLPLLIPTLQCSAAMLSGNTVVLKPSKFTPGVGQRVAEMWDRCKLPRGTFNMVQGSGASIGQRLSTHPGLDALLFSGSFTTAMAIRRATFDRPELPTLYQCGGKGCAVVLDGCDINRAVYEVLVGAFLTAGQRHNSTGRVIVTKSVFDAFRHEIGRRASQVSVGYGFDKSSFFGPVISENFRTRYRRYVRALVERGHSHILEGGNCEVEGRRGFYVSPAIYWVNWENGHAFINEEPPGPTLLVYRVSGWEEAVALHNKLLYRVSTSLFVPAGAPHLGEIVGRLKTGSLNLNRGTIGASLRLPSVGLGRSSNGIPGGIDLLRFLSTPRSTLVETRPFDPSQAVPGINWHADTDLSDDLELV
ncbi:MAG: aldehyde dehydrogenase family protein [Proteobacteria bacterium]|nr:aldehyde dehydrogenase family protein [Pseudomonadota bacterium]